MTVRAALAHLARLGPTFVLLSVAEQVRSTKLFLGLRADLAILPQVRPAKIPLRMEPVEASTFTDFADELGRTSGSEHLQALIRTWSCAAGVRQLHVAVDRDGAPVYAQWLVRPRDQRIIDAHSPGRYPVLRDDEVLLEGAYTFTRFRGIGAMPDGMGQLLAIARAEGFAHAITYVAADNIPSLRGCARVGFRPDHQRENHHRLGSTRSVARPFDDRVRSIWNAATGAAPGADALPADATPSPS
jgi:RimJ/RimL family protein N-acetyltransferase